MSEATHRGTDLHRTKQENNNARPKITVRKQVGNAQAEMKKVVNRDLMQAIVGGGLLIAAADGDIEASEVSKLD